MNQNEQNEPFASINYLLSNQYQQRSIKHNQNKKQIIQKDYKGQFKINVGPQHSDYQDAVEFAKFIGLNSNKIKMKTIELQQQKFFKINNYISSKSNTRSSELIKSEIFGKNINYFDLKKIWQQRCKKLKLEAFKKYEKQKYQRLKNIQIDKDKRICSLKNIPQSNSYTIQKFSQMIESDKDLRKLRTKTARQLYQRKICKKQQNSQIGIFVHKVYNQKVIRSKILNEIYKDQTIDSDEQADIDYKKWKNSNQKDVKQNKCPSSCKKTHSYLYQSQFTKQKSTQISPSIGFSPNISQNNGRQYVKHKEQKNQGITKQQYLQNFEINPENINERSKRKNFIRSSKFIEVDRSGQKMIKERTYCMTPKQIYRNRIGLKQGQKQRRSMSMIKRMQLSFKGRTQTVYNQNQKKVVINDQFIKQGQNTQKKGRYTKIRLKLNNKTNNFQFCVK